MSKREKDLFGIKNAPFGPGKNAKIFDNDQKRHPFSFGEFKTRWASNAGMKGNWLKSSGIENVWK